MSMEYSEKLKDPRWQKKRLQIFERDEWSCQRCYDSETTLAVHHRRYLQDKDPWDYPSELLVTLCEDCHEYEKQTLPDREHDLLAILRSQFLSDDIQSLATGFYELELLHAPEVVASVFEWALSSKEIQRELISRYFEYLKTKTRE